MQQLSKPQRRLLLLASKQTVERRDQHAFDMLVFFGLITAEGKITKSGRDWLKGEKDE